MRRRSGSSSILNLIIFDLYAVVIKFSVKVVHSLIGSFSDVSYLFVVYVYNDCHRKNQNHCSKMGRTSHLSDAYDAFSSLCASFSLLSSLMTMTLTNHMTTVQGTGSLLVCAFCYVLNQNHRSRMGRTIHLSECLRRFFFFVRFFFLALESDDDDSDESYDDGSGYRFTSGLCCLLRFEPSTDLVI